jgi:NTE family protein
MPGIPITLALQGGGSHGAFSWGAAKQILADGRLRVQAITATSGGAMTAVVMADALTRGGPEAAIEQMKTFWRKVSVAASLLPFHTTVMDKMLGSVGLDLSPSSIALDYITRMFSPYQFNLFDLNPLRGIVEETVDFEHLRQQKDIRLFINATDVKSGKAKVFSNADISLDAVMASSCLPFLFKTVLVDGEPYWDGGYSGNPALTPLLESNAPRDVVLLQSAAATADDAPTRAADILDRATEISFANSFAQQMALVEMHNRYNPKNALRVHTIESADLLASLGRASKLNADWEFLMYLHDLGSQAAGDWLENFSQKMSKDGAAA